MFDIVSIPMGYVLRFLSSLVGDNFAAAVFVFTVLVNLAMIPLTIKSQKSSVQQMRIRPKLDLLKAECGDDRQLYSTKMQELYQKENVSMSGGCLPMLLRMLFMMGIYYAISNPLRYLCGVSADVVNEAVKELGLKSPMALIEPVLRGDVATIPADKLGNIDFLLFGNPALDLTKTPHFTLDFSKAQLIWLIPISSFIAQMATTVVSTKIQKLHNPDMPNMSLMLFTMPLFSLFIGFGFPGALGFYWTCSALVSGTIQIIVSLKYGPNVIIAKEQSRDVYARYQKEEKRPRGGAQK